MTVKPKLAQSMLSDAIALSAARIDVYYHHSSNIHIVMQAEGTELGPLAIKGYSDFVDEAFDFFVRNLTRELRTLSASELKEYADRVRATPPSCSKRSELQISLTEKLSRDISNKAKSHNLSVSQLVERLIRERLPKSLDHNTITSWAEEIKGVLSTNHIMVEAYRGNAVRNQAMALPLTVSEYESFEAIMHETSCSAFGDIIEDILIGYVAAPDSQPKVVH